MSTEKQISYALSLMAKAGYGVAYMRSEHKKLGASMRERSGKVRDWLAKMERVEISKLIDDLKK